jgi:CRP-like cAMP-binding protein
LSAASVTADFLPGEQLIRQGSDPDGAWIITDGEVELRRNAKPVALYGPGELVGDLSLLSGNPHSVEAIAKTTGSRVLIGSGEFKAAVRHHPEVADQIIKVLVQRIYEVQALLDGARGD